MQFHHRGGMRIRSGSIIGVESSWCTWYWIGLDALIQNLIKHVSITWLLISCSHNSFLAQNALCVGSLVFSLLMDICRTLVIQVHTTHWDLTLQTMGLQAHWLSLPHLRPEVYIKARFPMSAVFLGSTDVDKAMIKVEYLFEFDSLNMLL